MITPEIISYIKSEKSKQTPDPLIRSRLIENGWQATDIDEALASIAGVSTDAVLQISKKSLKAQKNRAIWTTFAVLVVIDFILIMLMGGQGLFGISFVSIVVRLVVIFAISTFASSGIKAGQSSTKSVLSSVARGVAAVVVTVLIVVGIIFAFCFFAFQNI